MSHSCRSKGLACLGLLAGLILLSQAPKAQAADIGFQNQLNVSIYVEGVSIIRGQALRDKPLLIHAGKIAWHMNVPPGTRVVYVYLVNRPGQLMFRGAVMVGANNLFFAVQPQRGPRGLAGVTVVPAKPPKRAAAKPAK